MPRRLSQWYWQCLPQGSSQAPAPAPSGLNAGSHVPDWGQCGGAGGTCPLVDKALCTDSAYLPCAGATSSCTRISGWYWQVLGALPLIRLPAYHMTLHDVTVLHLQQQEAAHAPPIACMQGFF